MGYRGIYNIFNGKPIKNIGVFGGIFLGISSSQGFPRFDWGEKSCNHWEFHTMLFLNRGHSENISNKHEHPFQLFAK